MFYLPTGLEKVKIGAACMMPRMVRKEVWLGHRRVRAPRIFKNKRCGVIYAQDQNMGNFFQENISLYQVLMKFLTIFVAKLE